MQILVQKINIIINFFFFIFCRFKSSLYLCSAKSHERVRSR